MEHMSSTNPFTRARLAAEAPRFRKLSYGYGTYEVSINGTVAGTVKPSLHSDVWHSFYNDGTQGHSGDTRKAAAWALINS